MLFTAGISDFAELKHVPPEVITRSVCDFSAWVMRYELSLSSNISHCHAEPLQERGPKWRDWALAIKFWIATVLVGGSFLVGAWHALKNPF